MTAIPDHSGSVDALASSGGILMLSPDKATDTRLPDPTGFNA